MNNLNVIETTNNDIDIDLSKAPIPVGCRLLIKPRLPKEKTDGGLYLMQDTQQAQENVTAVGTILAMGTGAYQDRETGDPWKGNYPKIGDTVIYGKWAGQKITADDEKYVILNDEDITAIVPSNIKIEVTK